MPVADRKRYQNRRWQHRVWGERQVYLKSYYQRNKDKIKRKSHDRYHSNPGEHIKKHVAYVQRNAAKKRIWFAGYREKNRGKILAKQLEWRNNNRGKWTAISSRRRALVRQVSVNSTGIAEWMQEMRSRSFVICYYCQNLIHACEQHFDHVIPISRGGPHEIGNLCVSCPGCNLSKGSKTITEWDNKPEPILNL